LFFYWISYIIFQSTKPNQEGVFQG
jgi:hypothetical protein